MRADENKSIKSRSREGFSLIELIIAIAIVGIVMSGVLLLISYATNSMRRTNNQVTIQNQAKDALTHITTHLQEASAAKFYDDDTTNTHVLITLKMKDYRPDDVLKSVIPKKIDVGLYWKGDYTDPSTSETEKVVYYRDWEFPTDWGRSDYDNRERGVADNPGGVFFTNKSGILYDGILSDMKSRFDDYINNGKMFGSTDPRTFILCKNVDVFKHEEDAVAVSSPSPSVSSVPTATPEPTPSGTALPSASPLPTASPAPISGKSVTFTLKLENYSGDTEFKTTKTVYLRNQ